ncbi:MAG: hypothetical protein VB858_05200 [Planctomycetaceae bacterium]
MMLSNGDGQLRPAGLQAVMPDATLRVEKVRTRSWKRNIKFM